MPLIPSTRQLKPATSKTSVVPVKALGNRVQPRSSKPVLQSAHERRENEQQRTRSREAVIDTDSRILRSRGLSSMTQVDDEDLPDNSPEPVDELDLLEDSEGGIDQDRDLDQEPEQDVGDDIVRSGNAILVQGVKVDPGPDISDVEFKPCCGTCAKFVRIDSPDRDNPEWEVRMMKRKHRCPCLFPREVDLRSMDAAERLEAIPTADHDPCKDYAVNFKHPNCTEEFNKVLELMREHLDQGALEIVQMIGSATLKLKTKEQKMGYQLGEVISSYDDDGRRFKAKVVDFTTRKGNEVIIETINRPHKQIRLSIPAKRAQVLDTEDE